jgi:hypothetical protein
MDTSDHVHIVTSGSIIVEKSSEDDAGTTLPFLNQTSIVGSSEQSPHKHSANVNVDSGNENQSQILKTNSDSDDSNESGSLPSESSSTIDTSGSHGKDDRLTVTCGTRVKSSKRKKDRSKLRKGKWTVSNVSSRLSNDIKANLTYNFHFL